jgi:predicted secreted protein
VLVNKSVKFINSYIDKIDHVSIGSGAQQHWVFKGVKPGITQLHMIYKQPWTKDQSNMIVHTIEVIE